MGYSELPTTVTPTNELTEMEACLMKRAKRWVVFLCMIQLIMSFFLLFGGGLFMVIITVIFATFGLVGVKRENIRYLIAHFVYTLVIYILSLIALVAMFVYCTDCNWFAYILSFFWILFQAIGLRQSRILIFFLKQKNGVASGCRCQNNQCTQTVTITSETAATQTPQQVQIAMQTQTQPETKVTPVQPVQAQVFPSAQQFIAYPFPQNGQPNFNYMPMQPMRYPILPQQQPFQAMPQYFQPMPPTYGVVPPKQEGQMNTNVYPATPVVYKQQP